MRKPKTTVPLELRCEFSNDQSLALIKRSPRQFFSTKLPELELVPLVRSDFCLTAPYFVRDDGSFSSMKEPAGINHQLEIANGIQRQLTEDYARQITPKYLCGTALGVEITSVNLKLLDEPQTIDSGIKINALEVRGTLYRMREQG